MIDARLSSRLRLGVIVFLILAVLVFLEYALILFIRRGALRYLLVMNLVDAGFILYFYMHVRQLWRSEEE